MTSPLILLRIGALTAAFIAVQSAHGSARACEDTRPASQSPLAQTDAVDELRAGSGSSSAQSHQNISAEVELATGDGQQGFVSADPHRVR